MTSWARLKAISKNEITYKGKPCNKGHDGFRLVKSHNCVQCIKERYGRKKNNGRKGKAPNKNRLAAIENNELFYTTNKPCKNGHLSKRYVKGHECFQCKSENGINNKHKIKMNQIKRTFGLSEKEFFDMLEKQKYLCLICENKLNVDKHTHIDHCKKTKRVRGVLCHWCNIGIGQLKHDPELLRKAALYCEEI